MPSFVASDGFELHYELAGDGVPILLIHGWAVHGGFFDQLADGLSTDFMVIRPDLRGHRHSHATGVRPDMATYGRDLKELLDHLAVQEVITVGWSMGAHVAFEYLTQGGDRFAALVIEDMTPKIMNENGWAHGINNGFGFTQNQMAMAMMQSDWPRYAAMIGPNMLKTPDNMAADKLAWMTTQIQANDPDALVVAWGSMAQADYRDLLKEIQLPVRVVHGAGSGLYDSEAADWMIDQLPSAEKITFENSGHAPHLEEPWRFEALLRELVLEVGE